jgi:hypothetical protein
MTKIKRNNYVYQRSKGPKKYLRSILMNDVRLCTINMFVQFLFYQRNCENVATFRDKNRFSSDLSSFSNMSFREPLHVNWYKK